MGHGSRSCDLIKHVLPQQKQGRVVQRLLGEEWVRMQADMFWESMRALLITRNVSR